MLPVSRPAAARAAPGIGPQGPIELNPVPRAAGEPPRRAGSPAPFAALDPYPLGSRDRALKLVESRGRVEPGADGCSWTILRRPPFTVEPAPVPNDPILLTIAVVLALVLLVWAIARVWLRGEDLSAFDHPGGERPSSAERPQRRAPGGRGLAGAHPRGARGRAAPPTHRRAAPVPRQSVPRPGAGSRRSRPWTRAACRRSGCSRPVQTAPAAALHPRRRVHDGQPQEPPPADRKFSEAHRRRRAGDRLSADARAPAHGRHRGLPHRVPLDAR